MNCYLLYGTEQCEHSSKHLLLYTTEKTSCEFQPIIQGLKYREQLLLSRFKVFHDRRQKPES